jgi:sec-independent protein translocase protein TatA
LAQTAVDGSASGSVTLEGLLLKRVEVPMFDGLFQPMHLLVIFFIALLVFGPKKLPELGKGIGEGIRALKDGMKDTPAEPTKNPNTDVKS